MASSAKHLGTSRETIPSAFLTAYLSNDESYITQFNFRALLYLDESGQFYSEINTNPSGNVPMVRYQPPPTIATLRPRSLVQIEGPGEAFRFKQYDKLRHVVVKEGVDRQEALQSLWDHFNKAQQVYFKYLTTDKTNDTSDLRRYQLLPRSSSFANEKEFSLNMLLGVVSDIKHPTTGLSASRGSISLHILSEKAIADREQQPQHSPQHHSSSQSLPISSSSFSTARPHIARKYDIPFLPQLGDVCLVLTTKNGRYSTYYPLITSQQLLSDFAQHDDQPTSQQQQHQQPQQGHFTIDMLDGNDDDSETHRLTFNGRADVKKLLGELFDFHQQQVKICQAKLDAKDIMYTACIEDYQKIVDVYQEKKRAEEESKIKQHQQAEEKRKQQHLQYLQHLEQIEEEKQFIFSSLQHHNDHNILPVAHQVITQYPFLSTYITTNIITPFLQYQDEVRQFFLDNYPKTKTNNANNNHNNNNHTTKDTLNDHSAQKDDCDDDQMITTTTTTTTTASSGNPTTSANTVTTSQQQQHYQQQYEYLPLPTTTLMWRDYLDWILQQVQPDLVALSSPGLTAMLFQSFAEQHNINNINNTTATNHPNNQIPLLQQSLLSIISPHRYGQDPSHGRTPQLAEHKMKRTLSSLSRLWDHGYEKEEQVDKTKSVNNNNHTLISLKRKKPDPTIPNNITSSPIYQSNMNDDATDDITTTTTATPHNNQNNTLLLGSQSNIFPVTDADPNATSTSTSKPITPFTVQNIPLQQFLQQQDAALLQHFFSSDMFHHDDHHHHNNNQQTRQQQAQSTMDTCTKQLFKDHTNMMSSMALSELRTLLLHAQHSNDTLSTTNAQLEVKDKEYQHQLQCKEKEMQLTAQQLAAKDNQFELAVKEYQEQQQQLQQQLQEQQQQYQQQLKEQLVTQQLKEQQSHDVLKEQIAFLKSQLEAKDQHYHIELGAKDQQLGAKDKQIQQLFQLLSSASTGGQ